MFNKVKKSDKGFTLIEILIVIGIIAILATIVIIAINPARQFAQARNTQRTSNVNTILNAIGQRISDNKGVFAGTFEVAGEPYECPALEEVGVEYTIASASVAGNIDLACLFPTYIPTSLPFDPSDPDAYYWNSETDYNTGYTVSVDDPGRYTVKAPEAELDTTIEISR